MTNAATGGNHYVVQVKQPHFGTSDKTVDQHRAKHLFLLPAIGIVLRYKELWYQKHNQMGMKQNNQLSPEDQKRVDSVINSGYNSTERKPFRPLRLLFVLWIVVTCLGLIAWGYARYHGLV
jgi:quinol-cytochrome oxidoreductase complex cytochrome b subunit